MNDLATMLFSMPGMPARQDIYFANVLSLFIF